MSQYWTHDSRPVAKRIDSRMRVWIFNHYAECSGGMALRTFELSQEMVRRGHAVTIFASSFSHYRLREEHIRQWWRLWLQEEREGVRFIWLRGNGYSANDWRRVCNMLAYSVLALLIGLTTRPRPELVIGCSVHPCAALVGMALARVSRVRFVVEVPDLWPQVLVDFGRISAHGLTARILYQIERFLYTRAERIIMLWRNTQPYLRARGLDPGKAIWIPHVVEPSHNFSKPNSRKSDQFVVMFLGSFVQSMALDVVLDAAQILQERGRDDITIVLIGEGVEKRRIAQSAADRGLSNLVIRPAIPKYQVPQVLQEADACLCTFKNSPVYQYGLSMNKVCDYLMASRPIVFCGNSAYDPVAESRAGHTVPGEDSEGLARAIESLADTPEEARKEMGLRGRAFVLRHHSLQVLGDRLEEVLAGQALGSVSKQQSKVTANHCQL